MIQPVSRSQVYRSVILHNTYETCDDYCPVVWERVNNIIINGT